MKYIITKDEEWLVRLAMVKSAVKAMDCVQEFLAGTEADPLKIDHFVVAGASKAAGRRGSWARSIRASSPSFRW